MTFDEMSEAVARRAYQIEMAEGFVTVEASNARFDAFLTAMRERRSHGGPVVGVYHVVRSTLIAMREMGLIDFA